MALVDCPECKNPVSTDALACPHCGYESRDVATVLPQQQVVPVQAQAEPSNVLSILAIVFGAISVLFFPVIFALVGGVLAVIGFARGERLAPVGLAVAFVGGAVGAILGYLLWVG